MLSIGRALAHRNYRLFFFGQGVSLIGTWMQQVAMAWLVYRLSDSPALTPFLLGLVGFAGQIPSFVVSPLAGVFTDRWNRHHTLLVTQTLSMIHALLMTVLVLAGLITVWQIVVLAVVLGVINAVDMPTRQAFLIDMIDDRADLGNAIALNSSMFNGARLIGPALAGFLIALLGERTGAWTCFLLNAISYAAVLAALMAMRVTPRTTAAASGRILHGLQEGFAYAFGFLPIRAILGTLALMSLAGVPLMVLMPVLAGDILQGGPDTLGLLTAASGLGALAGAIFLASRKSVLGLGRLIALMMGLLGLATVGVSCSSVLWVSLILLATTGFAMIVTMAAGNTILQTIVEEDKRGRVMSLYTMAFMGVAPLGSLLAGGLASGIGTRWTLALSGLLSAIGGLMFAFKLPAVRKLLRPIYVQAGILQAAPVASPATVEIVIPPEV